MARRYKPGIPCADLGEAAAVLREAGHVTVTGCHVHAGRHMPGLSLMEAVLPGFARELRAFADAMGGGWTPAVVDVGGGFDLLVAAAALPELAEGDLLAFLDTGACQDAGANNFNAMPRPATVLVHGAEAEVVRRAETVAGVFARDVVPARLGAVDAVRLGTAAGARTLHHAGMVAADLERSVAFYARLLGVEPAGSGREDDPVYATMIGVPRVAFRWAEFDLGSGQALELIEWEGDEAPDPASPVAGALPSPPTSTHVVLRVADIDAAHRVLLDAGVTVFSAPVELREETHWLGARVLYARDHDGNLIELVEEPPPGT